MELRNQEMWNQPVRAILFDLDGTLINTLYSLQDTMNQVMKKFGCDEISLEQTRKYVGDGYQKFVERALQATSDRLLELSEKWEEKDEDKAFEYDQQADEVLELFDDACEEYLNIFSHNFLYRADAYEGMKESLMQFKEKGISLAVVTNKPAEAAQKALDTVFGEGYFDYVSADDGTHALKPDCRVVEDACLHLGVDKEVCLFVGDTNTDMQTARNAGIRSVGCAYGFRGREELIKHGADLVIESAAELMDLPLRS